MLFSWYLYYFLLFQVDFRVDGQCVKAYETDFENDQYIDAYVGLFRALNQQKDPGRMSMRFEDYKTTHTIFAVDLLSYVPSRVGKPGNVDVLCEFRHPLAAPMSLLIVSEYSSYFTIDAVGNVEDHL